jgi:hypothetical protein
MVCGKGIPLHHLCSPYPKSEFSMSAREGGQSLEQHMYLNMRVGLISNEL